MIRIRPIFAWYDLWVGVYVDIKGKAVYILPLPTVGLKVSWGEEAA